METEEPAASFSHFRLDLRHTQSKGKVGLEFKPALFKLFSLLLWGCQVHVLKFAQIYILFLSPAFYVVLAYSFEALGGL